MDEPGSWQRPLLGPSATSAKPHNATPLGDFYRHMRSRNGTKHAITATARKLAEIVYIMVTRTEASDYPDRDAYNQGLQRWRIRNLKRHATQLGFQLTEIAF